MGMRWRRSAQTLVALSVLALAPLAACGRAVGAASGPGATATLTSGPSPTPTACVASQQWQPPAGNTQLDALAVDGPGDGWAGGEITAQFGASGAASQPTGVIYHLMRGQWTQQPRTYPGADIVTISMDSPTDGWAASAPPTTAQPDRALVLHYTGGQWVPVDIPALDRIMAGPPGTLSGEYIQTISIQMFGPDAGWLFAWSNADRASAPSYANVIMRYQNGVWTEVPLPPLDSASTLFSFSAVSAGEAWLVATDYGSSGQMTRFAHYIHGAWSLWPVTFNGITERMSMTSPTDGWAFANGGPLHYDGKAWALAALPASWASAHIQVEGVLYATPSGAVWLGGSDGEGNALIEQFDHGRWSRIPWPYPDMLPVAFPGSGPLTLAGDGTGALYGAGDVTRLLGCPPTLQIYVEQGVFFQRTAGGVWSRRILP